MKINNAFADNSYNNDVLSGLTRYFPHYWGFIEALNIKGNSDKKPDWVTETRFKLDPVTLWKRFRDKNTLVGIRFATNEDATTKYLMVDLDKSGDLDPRIHPENFDKLLESAEESGLAGHALTQSSWREGLHLWFGLSKDIPVFDAACFLQKVIEGAGFKPKDGHIEAFPNCKSYGKKEIVNYKAHNLPLQPDSGSYLLDDDLNIISDNFCDFIGALDWTAAKNEVDEDMLERIKMAREAVTVERVCRNGKGKSNITKWKSDLEAFQEIGWTDFSQTNDLLCKFATYGVVFRGLEGEGLFNYVLETSKNAPGYFKYCLHQHNIEKRCLERARNAEKYYWALGDIPKRSGTYRELFGEREDIKDYVPQNSPKIAIQRIRETVEYLWKKIEQLPSTIREYRALLISTMRELHGAGASTRTLTKYKELWHPKELGLTLPKKTEPAPEKEDIKSVVIEPIENASKNPKPAENKDVFHLEKVETSETPKPAENKDVFHLSYMKVSEAPKALDVNVEVSLESEAPVFSSEISPELEKKKNKN